MASMRKIHKFLDEECLKAGFPPISPETMKKLRRLTCCLAARMMFPPGRYPLQPVLDKIEKIMEDENETSNRQPYPLHF